MAIAERQTKHREPDLAPELRSIKGGDWAAGRPGSRLPIQEIVTGKERIA